jgi:ADP-ribose pyrophosphatase
MEGNSMLEKEKLVDVKTIYEGGIIKVRVDTIESQNGNLSTREIVEHPGGVGIVALTPEGKVCMVRQYRRPFDDFLLEIPAGKLNWGEDHFGCAVRELEEETGYTANKYHYLGQFYPTPGFCTEIIHIYIATDLTKGQAHPDEDEFLELEEYTLDELSAMIMRGEIIDAKTVIGVLKARLFLGQEEGCTCI